MSIINVPRRAVVSGLVGSVAAVGVVHAGRAQTPDPLPCHLGSVLGTNEAADALLRNLSLASLAVAERPDCCDAIQQRDALALS